MDKLYQYLPVDFVNFILVTLFSLLIGLSQRRISLRREGDVTLFGTDRTFTFIGILGYLLYILDREDYHLFIGGGIVVGLLLAVNYYVKQVKHEAYGVTTIIIALITYCMAPMVCTQPSWLYITVVVTVLMFTEMKHTLTEIAQRMPNDEMVTVAKFLAISGVILPMLPDKNIISGINLTPYTIWFATVVVSGISYLSYILRRYVFRKSGIMVSGVLGGLYSSTATISVLAGKCKTARPTELNEYVAAMLMAVSMMFLRFMILIFIFSRETFVMIYPYLLAMCIFTAGVSLYIHSKWKNHHVNTDDSTDDTSNPLEFKVAIIFALLLVVFTVATHYTLIYLGDAGLNVLSFISGVSDITPFILNLLGNPMLENQLILQCSMQAMISNIIVNMCYAYFFSGRRREMRKVLGIGFGLVIVINGLIVGLSYLI